MNKRWVLLEHRLSKDNCEGIHFDLLLEEVGSCRTWRLQRFPTLDGPLVEAIPLPPHKLHWLEREESIVSGGRGWAKRIEGGFFLGLLPPKDQSKVSIELVSKTISGVFEIRNNLCGLISLERFNFI